MSALIDWLYDDLPDNKAENLKTGQRPPGVTDAEWFGTGRYFDYCHWYDKRGTGHCGGRWRHDHQPRIMKWYWASPLALVVPPIALAWEARWFILSDILDRLGWYRLLERFGVDTRPQ